MKQILSAGKLYPEYIKRDLADIYYDGMYWKNRVAELEQENRALRQPKFEGFAPRAYVPINQPIEKYFSLDEKIAEHIEGGTTESEAFAKILKWHRLTEEGAWSRYERHFERRKAAGTVGDDQNAGDAASPVQGEPAGS